MRWGVTREGLREVGQDKVGLRWAEDGGESCGGGGAGRWGRTRLWRHKRLLCLLLFITAIVQPPPLPEAMLPAPPCPGRRREVRFPQFGQKQGSPDKVLRRKPRQPLVHLQHAPKDVDIEERQNVQSDVICQAVEYGAAKL